MGWLLQKLNTFDWNLGKVNVGVDVKDWVVFELVVEVEVTDVVVCVIVLFVTGS